MEKFIGPLPTLAMIAKKAGDAIQPMQAQIVANREWEEKSDGSRVTKADYLAHQIITTELAANYKTVPVVSEEGDPASNAQALKSRDRFDTDPLDNTHGFTEGRNVYSVNIGRIRNGVPVEGAVYFPALQELYFTHDNKAWLKKGNQVPERIQVSRGALPDPVRVSAGSHDANVSFLGDRKYVVQNGFAQHRTCQIARGDADVTARNRGYKDGFQSWDVAGPHAVLLAAGGDFAVASDDAQNATPMRYGSDTTLLPTHIGGSMDALRLLGLLKTEHARGKTERG
jgi:3'(2'), 5'-bisphosphate nucleotidase